MQADAQRVRGKLPHRLSKADPRRLCILEVVAGAANASRKVPPREEPQILGRGPENVVVRAAATAAAAAGNSGHSSRGGGRRRRGRRRFAVPPPTDGS